MSVSRMSVESTDECGGWRSVCAWRRPRMGEQLEMCVDAWRCVL